MRSFALLPLSNRLALMGREYALGGAERTAAIGDRQRPGLVGANIRKGEPHELTVIDAVALDHVLPAIDGYLTRWRCGEVDGLDGVVPRGHERAFVVFHSLTPSC